MKENKKLQILVQCLFQVMISNICLILYVLFCSVFLKTQSILLSLSTPTIFALVVQPIFLEKVLFKSKVNFSKHIIVVISALVSILICYFVNIPENIILILHFILIGYSEEILYRMIILDRMKSSYNILESIVITALIFAFLGHISEPILDNLMIRFPLGIFLAFIRIRFNNIGIPTIIHALYNVLVTF
ncbi:CPBP family intramembrane metalloprotease [Streptococcus ovuberis]|uniref:CPBP family intramembrane metalloprotease n=2 Tax=Streptococcus ovuberis TaxID=1936207 RepID=A0A7X6S1K0_9STRE|nr:CPBP family intramembrane metalloprotease [Streptococcus ovuberis]